MPLRIAVAGTSASSFTLGWNPVQYGPLPVGVIGVNVM